MNPVEKPESRKGGQDPAILLVSEEPFLLKEREGQIRDSLIPPEGRDLNLLVLYGWEAGPGDIIEFLQTMPFLADCRLLVLREIQTLKDYKPVLEYLENPKKA